MLKTAFRLSSWEVENRSSCIIYGQRKVIKNISYYLIACKNVGVAVLRLLKEFKQLLDFPSAMLCQVDEKVDRRIKHC